MAAPLNYSLLMNSAKIPYDLVRSTQNNMDNQNLMNMAMQVIKGRGNNPVDYQMLSDAINALGMNMPPQAAQAAPGMVQAPYNNIPQSAMDNMGRIEGNASLNLKKQLEVARALIKQGEMLMQQGAAGAAAGGSRLPGIPLHGFPLFNINTLPMPFKMPTQGLREG